VHDFFDVLGLPSNAAASEVRRACARRARRAHPDFGDPPSSMACAAAGPWSASSDPARSDVAIDFVDVAALIDRMQAAFFDTTT
jgi:hypothetical protein